MASNHDQKQISENMKSGTAIMGVFFAIAFVLMMIGTCVEITSLGDKEEVKGKDDAAALFEAAKFRRLA